MGPRPGTSISIDLWLDLFLKTGPLLFLIGLGAVASWRLNIQAGHFAGLMIYIITPLIVFYGTIKAPLSPTLVFMPLLVWGLASTVALLTLWLGRCVLRDSRANVVALGAACGNTGYFGIPVALFTLGESALPVYIVVMLGVTLFENSLGFYLAAAGKSAPREALLRVLRLPSLYAFFLALLCSTVGWVIPTFMETTFESIRGAYVVLGMMIIGLAFGRLSEIRFDLPLTFLLLVCKFGLWPLLALGVIYLDGFLLWLPPGAAQSILLVSLMPVAANTVVIASLLGLYERPIATATLLSTLIALFSVPMLFAALI